MNLKLWRGLDSEYLERSLIIPANGSVVSPVDRIFPEAEEFLRGRVGWYTADADRRSVKTIYVVEDVISGRTSGEHGF